MGWEEGQRKKNDTLSSPRRTGFVLGQLFSLNDPRPIN